MPMNDKPVQPPPAATPLPPEVGERLLQQAFELWIQPEIERRRQAGTLPGGFSLSAAQIIFDLDTAAPRVRLNEEIRVVADLRVNRAIARGEGLAESDMDEILAMSLTDEDANAAHATMVLLKGRWTLAFDFRYNATRLVEAVDTAREFLDCAGSALEKGHLRAFVDNLFSATELLAKATLLARPDRQILEGRKHSQIATKYNMWGKLGNVDPRFVKLLNRLATLRTSARYPPSTFVLTPEQARADLATCEALFAAVRRDVPLRVHVDEDLRAKVGGGPSNPAGGGSPGRQPTGLVPG